MTCNTSLKTGTANFVMDCWQKLCNVDNGVSKFFCLGGVFYGIYWNLGWMEEVESFFWKSCSWSEQISVWAVILKEVLCIVPIFTYASWRSLFRYQFSKALPPARNTLLPFTCFRVLPLPNPNIFSSPKWLSKVLGPGLIRVWANSLEGNILKTMREIRIWTVY